MNTTQLEPQAEGGARVALLLLLPSLLLAWPGPGAILRDVFAATELTATGAALLATLPLSLYALLKCGVARPRFFVLWLPCLVLAIFAEQVPSWNLTDTLEADRGEWMIFIAAAAALAGAAANPSARSAFLRGSMLVSLALTLWALIAPAETALGGILGNTGELASAALFGAVLGARAIVREKGVWRLIAAATVLTFTVQAAAAPSIANVIAFLVGALACALLEPTRKSERLLRLGIAVLPLVALFALKSPSVQDTAPGDQPAETIFGGASVRASLAKGTFEMIDDTPLLGVGPGQFAVQFPRYRRIEEIEASTNRADARYYTEVEHPHQDWLLVLAEFGFVAGGALLLFWLLAGLRAFTVLRKGEATEAALGAGLLAVLAGSFANAPLGANPAAAMPAFVAMGMLLSRKIPAKSSLLARAALPGALFLLLCMSAPRAWNVVQHGNALASIGSAGNPTARVYRTSLDDALEACPDSVVARSLEARLSERLDDAAPKTLAAWRRVLELRPYRLEALLEASRQHGRENQFAAAEELATDALTLDPGHTTGLRNLTRYQFYAGRLAAGEASLAKLEERDLFDEKYALSLASSLLLGGQSREAIVVLERQSEEWKQLDGDLAWVEAGKRKAANEKLLDDAFASYAHLLWARAQIAVNNPTRAIAVYRQNLRITRDYVPGGPIRIRMELCAAQLLAGKNEDAAKTAQGLTPQASDWASVPAWAGAALRESGLLP